MAKISASYLQKKLKAVQEDLEGLELYVNEFSSFLPLPVLNVNPLGFILDINVAFEKLTGYKKIEMVGDSLEKFFSKKKRIVQITKRVLQGESVKGEELVLIAKKRKIPVSIYLTPRRDREGNIIGYFIGIYDISEFKKLQQGLEENVKERTKGLEESRKALMNILEDVEAVRAEAEEERDKTLAIVENFPEGLLFFGQENELSSINPKARDFFGLGRENLIGKDLGALRKISSLQPLIEILGEELEVYQKELKLREGLILEVSTIAIKRVEEKVETLVILRDVTREKIVERLKTEFVSIAAHQLRTPLSAIKWTLRMILDGDLGEVGEKQREFLSKTYQSNERMIKLINDLLNVTRIEEGRFLYNIQSQDIIEIAKKVIDSLKGIAKRKKVKFSFKTPKREIPKVRVDSEKISLVIQNLVDNAIHYTKLGGEIKVSLNFAKRENQILFSVKDTGIGIPKEQQKRVFTRFFRAANAIRAETEGTGLGLFIAKNIIEAHGGKIWFESVEGKGTTFYFTLRA